MMENNGFVNSLMTEIIQPGVEQLMNSRFFSELREGKLSRKRIKGFALQHYLSNHDTRSSSNSTRIPVEIGPSK